MNNNISSENLNSNIYYVYIYLSDNIDLDEKLLNPLVFSSMRSFVTYSSVRRIDTDIFSYSESSHTTGTEFCIADFCIGNVNFVANTFIFIH